MKKLMFLLILGIAFSACGDDDEKITAPVSNPVIKGSIKGIVKDRLTEEPIVGAFVTTYPLTSTTKTKEDGTFELPEISPDVYDISITHPDFKAFIEKIKVSDQLTNDIEFTLTSLASLNTPPDIPELIYPRIGDKIGFKTMNFRWEAADLDSDTLIFDIYFGVANTELSIIAENIKGNSFEFEYNFKEETNYEWYIVAKDRYSQSQSESTEFTFREIVLSNIPDLIGYWKLDGEALDYSPNAYNGTIENVIFVDDRENQVKGAAFFKGNSNTNSKILLPETIQLSSSFTISLWIKPDITLGENSNVGYYECVSKWGNSRSSWAFGINRDSYLFLNTYGSSATIKIATSTKVKANNWQHIAVTFENGSADFYIDGLLIFTAVGLQTPQNSTYKTSIGARQNQLSSFHGAIDEVYLFQRALTESEILKLSKE